MSTSADDNSIFRKAALEYKKRDIVEAEFPKSMRPYILKIVLGLTIVTGLVLVVISTLKIPLYTSAFGVLEKRGQNNLYDIKVLTTDSNVKTIEMGQMAYLNCTCFKMTLKSEVSKIGEIKLSPQEISAFFHEYNIKGLEVTQPQYPVYIALKKEQVPDVGAFSKLSGSSCQAKIRVGFQSVANLIF